MATCDRNPSPANEPPADQPSVLDNARQAAGIVASRLPLSRLKAGSLTAGEVRQLSPVALAYVGDVVYELYMRTHYLLPRRRIRAYHQQVVQQVNAERQADCLQQLLPHLCDRELDLIRRGRNASPKRPNRANPEAYQQATALEALIGYLYLTDLDRLEQLMNLVFIYLEELDGAQEDSESSS